jgi:hypothetical protein
MNWLSCAPLLAIAVLALAAVVSADGLRASEARGNPPFQDDPNLAEQERLKLYNAAQAIPEGMYAGREPDKDLETLALLKPLLEHAAALEEKYADGIASDNQPYRNLKGNINYCRERIANFENGLKQWASLNSIMEDVNHVKKMVGMAIENQAPAYFRDENDIAIRTRTIAHRIKAMEHLAPDSADLKKARELASTLAQEVATAQAKLLKGILEANELPQDNYTQSDRDALLKLVSSTWNGAAPDKTVVKTGLIGDNWTRKRQWEIQNRTLYEVDRSEIQGFVLVNHDSQTVACRRIQIRRDHTDNDKTTAWVISDPQSEPVPMELVLKSKLK